MIARGILFQWKRSRQVGTVGCHHKSVQELPNWKKLTAPWTEPISCVSFLVSIRLMGSPKSRKGNKLRREAGSHQMAWLLFR